MPLPAKRKTETGAPKRAKSRMGMVSADSGTGPAKKKLNRPVAGLQKAQMEGGAPDEPDESKDAKKSSGGKKKKPSAKKSSNPFGGY